MKYPKWELDGLPGPTVRFMDGNMGPLIATRKMWRLETEVDNDISELLDLNGIGHMRFFNKNKDRLIYWIYNKEDLQAAKLLI